MHRRIAAAAGVTLILTAVLFGPWVKRIELFSLGTNEVRFCAPVADGEEIVLSFTHSVNKRPVYDTLRIEGGSLVIVKSRFDAFGAGMPESSTDQGTFRVLPDGGLEWTVNRVVPEIVVRVGRVAGHTLQIRGREIALADLAEPGDGVRFRVERYSLFQMMKGGCLW